MNKKRIAKIVEAGLCSKTGIIGNGILYDLCKKYFCHKNPDAINAKIWLIGRAYAAAIERRKKYRNYPNDDFYKKRVVPIMMKSEIDQKLSAICKYRSVTENNILDILKVHKYLVDTFEKISGFKKRSLSSKYLHFHLRQLFFIYDSRSNSALKIISNNPVKEFDSIINNSGVDKEYAKFFCRSYKKISDLKKQLKRNIDTRQFDNILIMIANEKLRGSKKISIK